MTKGKAEDGFPVNKMLKIYYLQNCKMVVS